MSGTRLMATRCLALLVVALGGSYMVWRWTSTIAWSAWWIAVPLVLAETYSLGESVLYGITMWNARRRPAPSSAARGHTVDVFIATYNEPIDIVLTTAVAARNMTYPHQTWILDDGDRPEFAEAARRIGVGYIVRGPDWEGRPRFAKAGNVNNALFQTSGEFIAVLDADQVPEPHFLDRVLAYFDDPEVAFVQTPQQFWNVLPSDALGSQAELFYGPIQQGKDGWGAAFFCGSNAVLRREALMALGLTMFSRSAAERVRKELRTGRRRLATLAEDHTAELPDAAEACRQVVAALAEAEARVRKGDVLADVTFELRTQAAALIATPMVPESVADALRDVLERADVARTNQALAIDPIITSSITEDMATAMHLHALGWSSVYHHEVLVHGIAPEDVQTMLSQRTRWATGTMQVFFSDNPLLLRGLTIGQRLMYLATMTSYLNGFAAVVYIAAPIVFLLTGIFPINCDSIAFFVYFMPFFVSSQLMFVVAGNGAKGLWRGQQMSFALFPVWIKATLSGAVAAFFNRTLKFSVTQKTKQASGVGLRHVIPQLVAMAALVLAGGYGAVQALQHQRPGFASVITLLWVLIDLALLGAVVRAARYQGPGEAVKSPVAAAVATEVDRVVQHVVRLDPAVGNRGHEPTPTQTACHGDREILPPTVPGHLSAATCFDAAAALALRSTLSGATHSLPPVVLMDVSGVESVTPSAVAATLDLMRMVRARGGDLRIFGASPSFTMAHETMSLHHVTRLHGDDAEATGARRPIRSRLAPGAHRRERLQAH